MFYRIRISTGGGYFINHDKIFNNPESARADIARERARGALLAPVALVECTRRVHGYTWSLDEQVIETF